MFEMEAPRYAHVTDPASHQPELLSCRRGPSSQGLSHPRQPSVFEPQTVYLKAVPVPLYHLFQPPDQQAAGGQGPNVESSSVPMILSPILHSEKTELAPAVIQKQQGQTLTLNIVGTLPMLSSGFCSGSSIGSPGKSKNAGKYICEHCRRDCLKPSVLEKHIRSHTGERPFPCTTCGIAFKTQSNLYKHRRTQTHVNNARLSSESDSSILEESEKVLEASGQQPSTEREGQFSERGGHLSERGGHLSERGGHLSKRGSHLSECQRLHNKEMCPEMDSILEDTSSTTAPASSLVSRCRKVTSGDPKGHKQTAHVDPINPGDPLPDPQKVPSTTGVPPVLHVKKKLQEQRPLTTTRQVQLQRQQAAYSEKQLEFTASEQKLKKCESTDSGYLSHSDSADQQMWSCSPLHSLCEQSSEAEHEPNGSSLGDTALDISQLQLIEKTSSLPREKKNLEEHISKLISQNTKVVDKTQLDTVRPRKTVLSKQGSSDVLTPYTYKDSFHFDIKSLGGNRKNNFSLCSAKSTFTPLEKSKPLFFHSVPTQFSTTVDCVPVKRSHSLPFVENTGNLQEQAVNSKLSRMTHQPLDARFSILLHSGQCAANVTDCHNSHPRALVRQSAVDHLPSTHTADYSGGLDSKDGRGTAGHAPGTRCPTAGKKGSQRKLKMFSQEKWQMYGDETFKKIYQKKHCEITKKLKHDKESHLNDLTSLVSDLQVAGSRGGFTQQTHASAPAPSPVGGSLKPKQSDGCLCDGQVASQQTAQGSIRGLTEPSQPTNPTVRTRRSKTVSVQGHTCIPSPALRESSGGSPLSLNSRATWTPQVQQVTGQPSTSLTRPETRTQQGLDVQHYSLAALTTPNLPGLGCARSTYSDGESNNKAVHQQGKTIVRLGESSCGASSSAESSKEVGRLPSEKKKLKVEELGQINDLPFKLSTSNTKNAGDSDDTVTGRHWYTGPDQVESSNYPVVEEQEDVDGDAGDLEGTASEKTLGRPSESPDADHSKPSLDGASVSLSTVYSTPQGPQNTGKRDLMLEKHQNRPASSKCTVVGKNSLQALICTPSTTPQWLMQTTSVIHDSFSPKYLLKLPAAEAPGDPQATPATGEELSPSLSVTITEDALRLVSKAHRAESVVASVFSLSLQTEPTQQSVIVEPAAGVPAQQGTFLPDLPSTSTVSIATCIAYHCHGQSSTHQDITRDIRAQRDGSEERKPKMKAATTNIDSLAHTTSEILSCEPADTGDLLLSSENEHHHLHTADGPFLATTSILHAGKPSGTNQEESAEGWEPCHTWSCSPKGPPRDPHNSREHPKTSGGNSSDPCPRPAGSVCHTVTTQQRGGSALPRKGLSFHSGSKSIAATDVSFPCLNTELHMNWCCLARSLPCTVGQKEDTCSSSSLHAFRDHPAMGRPGLRCRVSVLDMMHASACLASTTTTEGVKAPASLTSYAEQKNKVDLATIRTSTKTSGQIMKTEASCKNEDTTVNTTDESKKAKITKKGCRGGQLHGYARFKAKRLYKLQWLPRKMSASLKKPHLPQTHGGVDERKRANQAGKISKKISKRRCGNKNTPVVPAGRLSGKDLSEEDKYAGRQVQPGYTASTLATGPESDDLGGEDQSIRNALQADVVQQAHLDSAGEADGEHVIDISSTTDGCPHTDLDLKGMSATSAVSPTTYSTNSADLRAPGASSDIFTSTARSSSLQNPVRLEFNELSHSGPESSSCWPFAPDFSDTVVHHLFEDADSKVTCLALSGAKADNHRMGTVTMALPGQGLAGLTSPRQTTVRMKQAKEDNTAGTHPSMAQDTLLGYCIASSAPSGSIDTSLPTRSATGCCKVGVHESEEMQVAESTLSIFKACPEKCNNPVGSSDCPGTCQETRTKVFEGSVSLLSALEGERNSDMAQKSVKKRSLEMMRQQTQGEYTDTSSDDDRLVIEI